MKLHLLSAFTLVAALATNGITFAQSEAPKDRNTPDSLLDRIRGTKHIGLRTDDGISGYVLYLYTKEQRADNLSELAAYRKDWEAFNARIESIDENRRSAQQRRASIDELNALTRERNRLQSQRPNSVFSRSIQLYDVSHVGDDYIELRGAEKPGDFSLVPLSRVCRVIVTSSDNAKKTGEPSDESKSR